MRTFTLICLLALLSVAMAQKKGLLSGAFSDAACTKFFSLSPAAPALRPGVLESGVCANVSGTLIKATDVGSNKYDAGFSCTAGCAGCLVNVAGKNYGGCDDLLAGAAYGQVFPVTDGTVLYASVFSAAGCTTLIGTETVTSVAFPTVCDAFASTALQGRARFLDIAISTAPNKVAILTGCATALPCADCANYMTGDLDTCITIKDASLAANVRYVKVSKTNPGAATTLPAGTTPTAGTTKPATTKPAATTAAPSPSAAPLLAFSAFAAVIAVLALAF